MMNDHSNLPDHPSQRQRARPGVSAPPDVKGGRESYVDVKQTAEHLGVPESWLYRSADLAGLPCYRVGFHRRYRLSDVDAWVQREAA